MPLLSFDCRQCFASGFVLDMSFAIEHRFTALFGPSGSGKTSILALIAGMLQPQRGRIRLADEALVDTAAGVWVSPEHRRVGLVHQDALLFPHLTVEGNLRFGQRHRRLQRRRVELARVAEMLEIGPLLKRYPRNLSGGERQRVAIGRALMSGPELLLMDEPLASLDAPLKQRILAYLERAVDEWQIPAVYVTHSQAEVRRAAQWTVVIHRGTLVATGPPEIALSQPEPLGWSNAAGLVNLLRLDQVDVHATHWSGRVGDQPLFLPYGGEAAVPPVFVQFSPRDVVLGTDVVLGLSARNHLCGRICQLITADRAVFVAVDVGQIVWAEITPEAASELRLQTGATVCCWIKTHSMQLVR